MGKITPRITGVVGENGKLKVDNAELLARHIASLRGVVEIDIRKPRKPRSDQENKYYWGVVVKMIAEHQGEFPEKIHEGLRSAFLKVCEKPLLIVKSTTELSTVEMEEYLANVRQWAATELTPGLYIPLPNEVVYE